MDPAVTLVYFSCEGREHLLARTAEALERHQSFPFRDKILAFDGPLAPGFSVADLGVKKVVNNVVRAGYVPSIQSALSLITTPYFFWQEDDCRFLRGFDLDNLVRQLEANPDWTQVGWGGGEKFPEDEKIFPLHRENMYETAYGFSARPALCRTEDLREAFAMKEGKNINVDQAFEEYLRDWLKLKSKRSVSIDPGEVSIYAHEGQLESVDRGLIQMKSSATTDSEKYISGLGHHKLPSLVRRIKNLCNLIGSTFRLANDQFYDLRRYDVAWRVVNVERTSRRPD